MAEDAGSFDLSVSQLKRAVEALQEFSSIDRATQRKEQASASSAEADALRPRVHGVLIEPLRRLTEYIETTVQAMDEANTDRVIVSPGNEMLRVLEVTIFPLLALRNRDVELRTHCFSYGCV